VSAVLIRVLPTVVDVSIIYHYGVENVVRIDLLVVNFPDERVRVNANRVRFTKQSGFGNDLAVRVVPLLWCDAPRRIRCTVPATALAPAARYSLVHA